MLFRTFNHGAVKLVEMLLGRFTNPACLIFDGMLPAIGSILTRVYRKLQKRVCYVGVNAGSETFQAMPCLFDGERIVGNGVLGLLPATDMHHVVEHDYPVSQTLMRATSARPISWIRSAVRFVVVESCRRAL